MRDTPIRKVVLGLLAYLDTTGYFSISDEEMRVALNVDATTYLDAKTLLQQLDPPGVGANSLQECLLLQAQRSHRSMAKFHRYSARNIDLIYSQNPEATQIAGFKQWKNDFNRSVNKGEKGIRIAAPIIKKLTPEDQKRLDTTEEKAIVGYRYIPVFDISQTSGEPVLSAKDFVKENLADHKNVTNLYNELKNYLNNNTDIKVSEKRLSELGGAKGYFQPSTNEIVIGSDEPDNALKMETLYHEYAHSQLHGLKSAFKDRPRAYQETQAEAVAYVAMQNIGVDTSNYSLGYVATWAKDTAVIHEALSEIQKVSNKVVDLSNELTEKLGLQQEKANKITEKIEDIAKEKSAYIHDYSYWFMWGGR
ncbi:RNA polymerase factor sigma-54 [Pediococcus ethanolidurans]|uniref:RNA polymerase factor sigma-54 n=1 Tax=Pediococcus ethanolidurans TaxID=319653 RepID=UPI0037CB5560